MVHGIVDQPDVFEMRFAVVPMSEVSVNDVWFMSGMKATGSNTVTINDVVVPDHRTLLATDLLLDPAEPLDGDGMAGLPVMPVLALIAAAPALGAAEAAVDLFRQRVSERVLAYTMGDKARDQPAAQIRLATVMSDLADAVARWERAVADVVTTGVAGPLSVDQRAAARLAAAATVRTSRRVISTVAEGAGATVYESTSPLQRLQRDVEVLKGHVLFDWDRTAEVVGRVALGIPLRLTDMI